jgi:excisionase family DNA binding protein
MGTALARPERAGIDDNARAYFSISQAADALGVSRVSIWRWINAGLLPVSRLGHRTARISRDDLNRVVAQRMVTGGGRLRAHAGPLRAVPPIDWTHASGVDHFVQFYELDGVLMSGVSQFVAAALSAGEAAVVVATADHRASIDAHLAQLGLDTAQAVHDGRFQCLDAGDTLAQFMGDELPDRDRFNETLNAVLDRATAPGRRIRVFGEMVALLAKQGNHVGAIKLETLWNELLQQRPFTLYCAYPIEHFSGDEHADTLHDVVGTHGGVIPVESYSGLADSGDRLREVLSLQQKAQSLEREIARRKQIEDRLRVSLSAEHAARESAEAALRIRDEFVSIASHELKTPLTTLSGYAQLVLRRFNREGQIDPERVIQALQAITNQADKLGRLLSQLLDVSRLEEGKLSLERQPTDVAALVHQLVEGAQSWSQRHSISLRAPASLEANVDGLRIEQVVANLLDNAVKYSPGGDIEVVLRQGRGTLELSVRDRGLGIPRKLRGQIFERFYQAHANNGRSGLGLGLFISRQIVELHGGQIRAEFPRGGGTRFVVRLPVAATAHKSSVGKPALAAD